MDIDALTELVRKRRSYRRFKSDPIPEGYVENILEVARWAMSGANGQPWEFVVVRDPGLRKKIADIKYNESRKYIRPLEETRVPELRHPAYYSEDEGPSFADAPVIIVLCADPRTFQASVLSTHFYGGEGSGMATFYKSMANATQLIHLAAAALGLGAQWVSTDSSWEPQVKELLGIPHILSVQTMVPIGYPAYKIAPPYRRKLSELVHNDKYDRSRLRNDAQIRDFLVELRKRTIPAYQV
ncbi:MAG: nitroreductase family protein [Chloroflexi bacterium]|nr:nitroreductase family protein [Chloroflexota bacterium]